MSSPFVEKSKHKGFTRAVSDHIMGVKDNPQPPNKPVKLAGNSKLGYTPPADVGDHTGALKKSDP